MTDRAFNILMSATIPWTVIFLLLYVFTKRGERSRHRALPTDTGKPMEFSERTRAQAERRRASLSFSKK